MIANGKTYDAVVVGAGAIGCSLAYHLCIMGQKVALIDSKDIASGSSSHCDAVVGVASGSLDSLFGRISYDSVRYTAKLAETFEYDFDCNPKGCIYVFESEVERELGAKYVEGKHERGMMDYRLIDNYELHELEPYIAEDLYGGYYCSGKTSMTVSPYKLCFAFVEEAKKTGNLTVYTYTKISGIRKNPVTNFIEAIETDKGTLYTEKIINCAGIWSNQIGAYVGIELPIYPRKGTILVSEKTKKLCYHKIFEYGYVASVHPDIKYERKIDEEDKPYNIAFNMEYTNDDNILIGGNRTDTGDTVSELEVIRAIARRGVRFYPELEKVNCIRSYAGLRPATRDFKPIMSEVPSVPGFYVCTGHEGSGILSCAMCGKVMAQLVAGEETDYDMSEFSVTRFEQAS